MFSAAATRTVIDVLYYLPNGVYRMNRAIHGLPLTSSNMGVVSMTEEGVNINIMMRSSSRSVKDDLLEHITGIARMCGALQIACSSWMPEWAYLPDSPIRKMASALYEEQTGQPMKEQAIHGGLELGVFCDKMPGMDILTIGCIGGGAHTVTEWLDLDSYARVYAFMKKVIEKLTEA